MPNPGLTLFSLLGLTPSLAWLALLVARFWIAFENYFLKNGTFTPF
jgi:hypothetical protein